MPGTNACSSAPTAGHLQLILGVTDALLEPPTVALRLAALSTLELRPCRVELLLRPRRVDLARIDGVVDERERPVLLDLEEPWAGRELDHVFGIAVAVDASRSGPQHRDEWRVPCEHADLTGVAGDDQHLDLALERGPIGRDEGERERLPRHYAGTGSAASSASASRSASSGPGSSASPSSSPRALATASSIDPTM